MSQVLPNYEGIGAKIRRGADQARALKADMDRFCAEVRRSIVHEVQDDGEEQTWVFRGETPKAPIDWSVRLGEILYNLRSALDHLVWQLVLANGQEPGRHTAFPIVRHEGAWGKQARNELRGVSQADVNTIRRIQPIEGGPGLPFDALGLWRLHSLCNIDKHRHLVFAVASSDGPRLRPRLLPPDRPTSAPPIRGRGALGTIRKGQVMLSLNNASVKFEPDFPITIRFADIGEREITAGIVPTIVRECLEAVRGAVGVLTRGRARPRYSGQARG